jgi:hypothetical protein
MARRETPARSRVPHGLTVRSWALTLGLVALSAHVFGQGLGDAARQEREQRKKTTSRAKVVTEVELAANDGQLANDPGQSDPLPPPEARQTERPPEPELPGVDILPATMSQEEYWRARAREARHRLAMARRRYEAIDREIRIGQPARYGKDGRRFIYSIHTLKAVADEAEAAVRAAEKALKELHEEGRRAGALPGWLRE